MDPFCLLLPPSAPRPFAVVVDTAATAPPKPTGLASARTVLPRRRSWRPRAGHRLPAVSAVARDALQADEAPAPSASEEERFDWLDQWYPFAPVGDLDQRAPHGKTVLGLNVVAWYDRAGAGEWRVFHDACPHRLAPLSEGRIDGKGRLQCAYHGWCFDGAGACRFIPQAPALGPPVHTNSRACVASYPCVVQNDILWFYPRTEPEFADVLQRKRPPFFAEMDDPAFFTVFGMRDFPYGLASSFFHARCSCVYDLDASSVDEDDILYLHRARRYDIMMENLLDPAHVPYAHKGLLPCFPNEEDPGRYHDREGGDPIKMKIQQANIDGFLSRMKRGDMKFVAPCALHGTNPGKVNVDGKIEPWFMYVLLCVPVSPGRRRLIWLWPKNHTTVVLPCVVESERNFAAVGLDKWHQACYVPTSSDAMTVAFRNWFRKYCKNQIIWAASQPQADHQLPPIQTMDKLFERYWSHVAQCRSCGAALKAMRALEVALQVASVAAIGFLAVAKGTPAASVVHRAAAVAAAVLCFAASRWLAGFIEENFHVAPPYTHADK
ncbi:hypothetical protein U9M48_010967 [Paspalum notatum var. saurae]|uniref:Rieske domain-containing protein n=1 Tax=Paspalum notatum var. saurae TaxID=547442 RepID=A0AAQ3WGT4_PASNO